jgi:hypothetical protein
MKTEDNVWKPFFFDGNQAWGFIDSPAEWARIVEAYKGNIKVLRGAKSCKHPTRTMPSFGFRIEYQEIPTLGVWADDNSIDLDIRSKRGFFGWFRDKIKGLLWLK